MTTNILLIIIIVLMVLGLILQFLQLFVMATMPDRLLDAFFDGFESDVDEVDIDIQSEEPAFEKSAKGFAKARKSKKAKWTIPNQTLKDAKKNQKDKSGIKGASEQSEPKIEVSN